MLFAQPNLKGFRYLGDEIKILHSNNLLNSKKNSTMQFNLYQNVAYNFKNLNSPYLRFAPHSLLLDIRAMRFLSFELFQRRIFHRAQWRIEI